MVMWKLAQVKRTPSTNVVVIVEWCCEAKDGRYHEVVYDQTQLDSKDPTAPDFIQFEDLTEEQLFDWVFAKIDKNAVEQNLIAIIDKQKAPELVSELPWENLREGN
jgi:hypothetical protein